MVDSFKVIPADARPKLRRLNSIERTVRYEWRNGRGKLQFSPAFGATLQEWARAKP